MKFKKLKLGVAVIAVGFGLSSISSTVQAAVYDTQTSSAENELSISKNEYNPNMFLESKAALPYQLANPGYGSPATHGGGIGSVIIVGGAGAAVGGGISYFKEHTKNARKSTHNKHTKPRPGRSNEKKKQKKSWTGKHSRH